MAAAAWWFVCGRRVRARNIAIRAAGSTALSYQIWLATNEQPCPANPVAAERTASFSILLLGDAADKRLVAVTLQSLQRQRGPYRWELLVRSAGDEAVQRQPQDPRIRLIGASTARDWVTEAVTCATGEWVIPLHAGDRLADDALAALDSAAAQAQASVIYGDCDLVSRWGLRSQPWFKPAFDIERFLAQDTISQACAIALPTARAAATAAHGHAGCTAYAMLLDAVICQQASVLHIPRILVHAARHRHEDAVIARQTAVAAAARTGGQTAALNGIAHVTPGPFGTLQVHYPLPEPAPHVTIVIPTRDRADILRTCVESLIALTRYPAFDVLIADNDSREAAALAYLDQLTSRLNVRVMHWPGPFNFSAINNFAVAQTRADYVCLLNNDTEVIDADWLHALMSMAVRDHVGAVGPMLLYPDGTIQHAGIVIGMGSAAGHAHRHQAPEERGYFAQAHVTGRVSAVTAACLVVAKHKYDAVGGLDATDLRVAYNDVDFCLKLQQAGWQNIYVPYARLIHHESKSRPSDLSTGQLDRYRAELATLQERWGTADYIDPAHHPVLDRASEIYQIDLSAHLSGAPR
ncbi:glycosyltransferase family 2 protein [Novosphingobium sp. FKTRR1]|uniref:glycosyltransferase family 2 protein n=1 Tax=Novosphingobium sp. FKTRR1 TaxID=2879118 RepID=UPI001CEFF83A|nr:glycosyltransferase family 2 protein [Novosphingobium sp. FKTRR1]